MLKSMMCLRNILVALGFGLLLSNCATYVTPGGPAKMSALSDAGINEMMARQPAAQFPARLSVARLQASGYRSSVSAGYGFGNFSIVTTRDVESNDDFQSISQMPYVAGVAPLNRILLPEQLESLKPLRMAAAQLRSDILLVYTFDTSFHVGEQTLMPLNVIALGFLDNKEVSVSTTVSAAFYDVRTEFLYGLAEATVMKKQHTSVWKKSDTVDELRLETEQLAFKKVIPEITQTWQGVVSQFAEQPTRQLKSKSHPQLTDDNYPYRFRLMDSHSQGRSF